MKLAHILAVEETILSDLLEPKLRIYRRCFRARFEVRRHSIGIRPLQSHIDESPCESALLVRWVDGQATKIYASISTSGW